MSLPESAYKFVNALQGGLQDDVPIFTSYSKRGNFIWERILYETPFWRERGGPSAERMGDS